MRKPTPEQVVQQEADESHAIHTQIVAALLDGRAAVWRLAEAFHELNERRGWQALGFDTLGEYLAQPEIAYQRAAFYALVGMWQELKLRRVARERVERLEWTKLRVTVPALKAGNVTIEDAVSDAEALSRSDLIEKYVSTRVDTMRAAPEGGEREHEQGEDREGESDPAKTPPSSSGQLAEPVRADELEPPNSVAVPVETAPPAEQETGDGKTAARCRRLLEHARVELDEAIARGGESALISMQTVKVARTVLAHQLGRKGGV